MSDIAVRAEGIAKRYRIGASQKAKYVTFREQLNELLSNPFRRRSRPNGTPDHVWALNDISFEIHSGEVVGLIGHNGAGKSTLLKILSRITEPTRGRAEIHGRVASLLEVGTGFHPELTGRENTYLNGAILGMRRKEIDQKFDEIVAFAEIETFIDTPVKFYSSGMYLRLAFAVAAHLEPEILVIDEVLAVGDARFQKKCLNKMQDVGERGRTVLFVSHSMPAITRLCQRVILLGGGRVIQDGPATQVVGSYLSSGLGTSAVREWSPEQAPGGEIARLLAVRVRNDLGEVSEAIDIRRPVRLEMEYEVLQAERVLLPHFHVTNDEGLRIFSVLDTDPQWRQQPRPCGRYISTAIIPGNLLAEGTLFVQPNLVSLDPITHQFTAPDAVAFQVVDSNDGDSARGDWPKRLGGVVRPLVPWSTSFEPSEIMME